MSSETSALQGCHDDPVPTVAEVSNAVEGGLTENKPLAHGEDPAYFIHSPNSLRRYNGLRFLYNELKYQRPVEKPQTLSFLDLPAELRVEIYKLVLVLDEPIEAWAETGDQYDDHRVRHRNRKMYHKSFKNEHNLRVLRTSRVIYQEANSIFYSDNEFRFSVAMPFRSGDRSKYGWNWNPHNRARCAEVYQKMPFAFPTGHGRFKCEQLNYERSWKFLVRKLCKARNLKSLALILPEHCTYGYSTDTKSTNTILGGFKKLTAARPFLELHAVRMFDRYAGVGVLSTSHADIIETFRSLAVCRIQFALFEIGGQWDQVFQDLCVNKQGSPDMHREKDANLYPVDIIPDLRRIFESTWSQN